MVNKRISPKIKQCIVVSILSLLIGPFLTYGFFYLISEGVVGIHLMHGMKRISFSIGIVIIAIVISNWIYGKTSESTDRMSQIAACLLTCFMAPYFLFMVFNNIFATTGQQGQQKKADKKAQTFLVKACSDTEQTQCIENAVLLAAQITPNSAALLMQAVKDNEATTVCFDSMGGANPAAIAIIKFVQEEKLTTCMASHYFSGDKELKKQNEQAPKICYSACPLIFLASDRRVLLGDNLKVGVHHSGTAIDFGLLKVKYNSGGQEFLSQYKGDKRKSDFVEFSRQVPFHDTRYLSIDELKAHYFATEYL